MFLFMCVNSIRTVCLSLTLLLLYCLNCFLITLLLSRHINKRLLTNVTTVSRGTSGILSVVMILAVYGAFVVLPL